MLASETNTFAKQMRFDTPSACCGVIHLIYILGYGISASAEMTARKYFVSWT